jgi:hypothetical protein
VDPVSAQDIDVTAYIANLNTARVTELCIRSMRHLAGMPFQLVVGDCGSTDGSLPMLERFQQRGWLELQVAPRGRGHADWLAGWMRSCTTRYALFSDSDVEFRGTGWLRDMVATAQERGAALVCGRMQHGSECYVHPVTKAERRLAPRPTAWLLMIDREQVEGLVEPDFEYHEVEDFRAFGGKVAYDTAAWYFKRLCDAGLTWAEMPASWQGKYHHFGGLTWLGPRRSGPAWRIRARQAAKLVIVERHLRRARHEHWGEEPAAVSHATS